MSEGSANTEEIVKRNRFTSTSKEELMSVIRKIVSGEQTEIPEVWDFSQVNDFSGLFQGIQDFSRLGFIETWDVSKVTIMDGTFVKCTTFNIPLNNWNVSNVTRMTFMFFGCTTFNQPLDKWNVSNVKEMSSMFFMCTNFNQPLNNWQIDMGTDTTNMFNGCNIDEGNKPMIHKIQNNEVDNKPNTHKIQHNEVADTVNQIMIWIPKGMSEHDAGLKLVQIMINNLKVKKIKSRRYRNFGELFIEPSDTFCGKHMKTDYVLSYAEHYLTLLSVKQQKTDFTITDIYAILVFRVKNPSHLEVIAFCGNNNNKLAKGHGTKLLNLVKQSMGLAKIDNIILNPVDEAIPYYVKQFFHLAVPGDDIYVDKDYKMMKSHLPSEKRLRKSLKPRPALNSQTSTHSPAPNSRTSKRRSASNSRTSKRRSAPNSHTSTRSPSFTFYRPSSHERLSNSSHLIDSFKSPKTREKYQKIQELCNFFCRENKENGLPIDGYENEIFREVERGFANHFNNDDDPYPTLNDRQKKFLEKLIESCK